MVRSRLCWNDWKTASCNGDSNVLWGRTEELVQVSAKSRQGKRAEVALFQKASTNTLRVVKPWFKAP